MTVSLKQKRDRDMQTANLVGRGHASRTRFNDADIRSWREQGFAIVPGFFDQDELTVIIDDYERLYGVRRPTSGAALDRKEPGQVGRFDRHQFMHIDTLPFAGSLPMNLLPMHPALVAFARAALGAPDVHLYQAHTWAKFTGEADFDQPFHCDFSNHTLTVPADTPSERTIDFIIYLTDVTDAHGALHYVPKPDSDAILGAGAVYANTAQEQALLKARERSAAGPAGTLLAHGIDTFHRGTNLTAPGGHRYTMTVGYKARGNEQIGFHVWQSSAERDWGPILSYGTPEQLAVLGIPLPGHPFWTPRTLALTATRWPTWDLEPWRSAAASCG
ncbi:MAG: phytanoyl-CoA dioxygenase family protein [Pseudomonadales bacterium]